MFSFPHNQLVFIEYFVENQHGHGWSGWNTNSFLSPPTLLQIRVIFYVVQQETPAGKHFIPYVVCNKWRKSFWLTVYVMQYCSILKVLACFTKTFLMKTIGFVNVFRKKFAVSRCGQIYHCNICNYIFRQTFR